MEDRDLKFKIGDRVKIVNDEQGLLGREGRIHDVDHVDRDMIYHVELRGDMGFWWLEHSHLGELE